MNAALVTPGFTTPKEELAKLSTRVGPVLSPKELKDDLSTQYAQLQENYASWQVRVDQGESFSQPNTPGGSNRGKSPGADQLGADTIVSDADDQSFASKNNESPPPPRLAQPRAAAALTEEP